MTVQPNRNLIVNNFIIHNRDSYKIEVIDIQNGQED